MNLETTPHGNVAELEHNDLQVVFAAAGHRFAVPYGVVEQMVTPPAVVRVPNVHPAVRGVVNLRGVVLGMVDLRALIGAQPADAEAAALADELATHERAHRAWIGELEAATAEGRPFTLTTDPQACDFGRWRDGFQPENLQLRALLQRMDEPHRHIHDLAQRVVALNQRGQPDEARALIARTRDNGLARLLRLFGDARELVMNSHRDIALVLSLAGRTPLALLVDSVDSVSVLTPASVSEQSSEHAFGGLIASLSTDRDGQLVATLDVEALYVMLDC